MDFVEEMNTWQEIPLAGNEQRSGLIEIQAEFPDPEGLLETTYAFVRRLKCTAMRVITRQVRTAVFEEYAFATEPGLCIVSANDTEGIRRGLYHLADVLRIYTPDKLPKTSETFTPKISVRFCRYSFGSAKHPSSYEEFAEDFDAYPEPFLERMAYEGANVLWFTAGRLDKICLNDWCPEDSERKTRRYERIQEAVDRCRKFGLRLFVYMVIPNYVHFGTKLLQDHPSIKGPQLNSYNLFCPAYDGKRFLYDCTRQLFTSVKGLGGILAIVQGEGAAFCPDQLEYGGTLCNNRCGLSPAEIYATGITAIFDGMRSANPTADLVAWFYLPFAKKAPEYIEELVSKTPKDIIYQCNAESGAMPVQLGKARYIGDYWQAFTGTAPVFDAFAAAVKRGGGRLGAKIQVGTSHEVGSVPYVPVPALTYRKYASLQSKGVSMVMQGWKTGGTPGLMNMAAGRLAFLDCNQVSEDEFLRNLAQSIWGMEVAEEAVQGWKLLSDAFSNNYPYSNMIQYFGPVADGVNWPLCVTPEEKPLLPTWSMNKGEISGDNLWECLGGHTFAEVVQLFSELSSQWHKGAEVFRGISAKITPNRIQKLEICRIEALEILFGTACRIFRFYSLRQQYLSGDKGVLQEMRTIVNEEISERKHMQAILDIDPLIGYNPEAHGNKFDRQSIEKGLISLQQTLADLNEAETAPAPARICHGKAALDGSLQERQYLSWSATTNNGMLDISIQLPGHFQASDDLFIAFDDNGEHAPIIGHIDCLGRIFVKAQGAEYIYHTDEAGWHVDMHFPFDALPGGNPQKCRFNITRLMNAADHEFFCTWPGAVTELITPRLNLAYYNACDMGELC